jgi:transcriptional regulator with XRE-family HTH domain
VTLGQKLKGLRQLEGVCRGQAHGLSKADMVKLIDEELNERISLAYLSQLESGKRSHMTNRTRLLLARFFRIHPGYLVDDPADFREHLGSPVASTADGLVPWLRAGALRFHHDPLVAEVLERLAATSDRRKAFRVLRQLLVMPGLLDKLLLTVEVSRR